MNQQDFAQIFKNTQHINNKIPDTNRKGPTFINGLFIKYFGRFCLSFKCVLQEECEGGMEDTLFRFISFCFGNFTVFQN